MWVFNGKSNWQASEQVKPKKKTLEIQRRKRLATDKECQLQKYPKYSNKMNLASYKKTKIIPVKIKKIQEYYLIITSKAGQI